MQQTRLFGQTFNWISKLPFVWQVFAFLFPTAAAAMTAWLASIQGEPWHLVIFYGLGAGAFAKVTYAGLLRLAWDYTLKHKLYIDEFIPMILNEGGNRIAATFKCVFSNISDFPLEIVLEHPSFSLQDKINSAAGDTPLGPFYIAAHSDATLTLPLISNINIKEPIFGGFKFDAKYGLPGKNKFRTLKQIFSFGLTVTRSKDQYESIQTVSCELQEYS